MPSFGFSTKAATSTKSPSTLPGEMDFQAADHVAADAVVCVHHTLHAARLADQQFVGEEDRERLIANDIARAPHRMPQPHRFLLADIRNGARRQPRLMEQFH